MTQFVFSVILLCSTLVHSQSLIFKTNAGKISFISEAPLETIKASTKKMSGAINLSSGAFNFKIHMNTFEGFNNPLQKEHFFENYMETESYPESTFNGKIIETIASEGKKKIRAKGMLTIHGVTNEILLDVFIDWQGNNISFQTNFDIYLEDYDIVVPKIVSQKISPIIHTTVSGVMTKI